MENCIKIAFGESRGDRLAQQCIDLTGGPVQLFAAHAAAVHW